jgi:uncharacterized membrane protein
MSERIKETIRRISHIVKVENYKYNHDYMKTTKKLVFTDNQKAVYDYLKKIYSRKGNVPSQRFIAMKLGMPRSTVWNIIKTLKAKKLLK